MSDEDRFHTKDGLRQSAGELVKEISEDFSTLLRKEIELAKQELGGSVNEWIKGGVIAGVVAAVGVFALVFLLLALRDGLTNVLPVWASDLVTAGVLILVGAVSAFVAKRKLKTRISTEFTKRTLKEDVEWAKTLAKR